MSATAEQRRYWTRVAARGCMVTGGPAEIAHCIGKPSVTERVREPKPKGKKLTRHNWLVIPLAPALHRFAPDALDIDAAAFERRHGPVAGMIDRLVAELGVDVWTLSQEGRK
jgi:hypothetical protein